MRYFIVRRGIRRILLFVLLVVVLLSAAPRIYEKLFVHDEDFVVDARPFFDFPDFLTGPETDKHISLDMAFLNNGYVFSELRIKDLKLEDVVVTADIAAKGRFIKDIDGRNIGFSGKLLSKNITLNSGAFLPIKMSFEISKDELNIKDLHLGEPYKLEGRIMLTHPFKTDLRLDIIRLDMRAETSASKVKGRDVIFGIVNGTFHIQGNAGENLFSQGIIESRNGTVGLVGYNVITVRLEGFGPIINIVDSSVKQDSGNLTIEGYVDLRNIAKGNLFDGIRFKSDMKRIAWDGWDITKKGTDELSMKKDVGENMRVGFKTMSRQPLTAYDKMQNPEEMSLEYRMGLENLKMRLKENEEFFGVEHSVKF